MKKTFCLIVLLLIFTKPASCMMGDEPDRSKVDMPEAAVKLLPDNGDVIASCKADLNGDGKDDFLIAFEYLNAQRELIVVINTEKGYMIAARSKRVIRCKECGGVYGDPFVRIWADKKKFGVDHFGGSNFKWQDSSEFGYSRRDKKWQLLSFDAINYDLDSNADEKKFKSADFGLINLEEFDVENSISGDTIKPVPDEEEAAANEEKTAVAGQKTAVAVSSFTPTPVPEYVYKKPEELKNTEFVTMTGGGFTQSYGNESFKNTLSPFKIGKRPVTYELWYVVKAWAVKNGYKFEMAGMEKQYGQNELPVKDSLNPVIGISWRDAMVWCNAYSQMEKLRPFYYSDAVFKDPIKSSVFGDFPSSLNKAKGGFDNPYVDWSAGGYRLPTEGEWLYAVSYIDGRKWLEPSALNNDANGAGFVYDPKRLSEWVWDYYGDYPAGDMKDYRGPGPGDTPAGRPKVLHGGMTEKSATDPNTFAVSVGYRIQEYTLVCSQRNGFRVAGNK